MRVRDALKVAGYGSVCRFPLRVAQIVAATTTPTTTLVRTRADLHDSWRFACCEQSSPGTCSIQFAQADNISCTKLLIDTPTDGTVAASRTAKYRSDFPLLAATAWCSFAVVASSCASCASVASSLVPDPCRPRCSWCPSPHPQLPATVQPRRSLCSPQPTTPSPISLFATLCSDTRLLRCGCAIQPARRRGRIPRGPVRLVASRAAALAVLIVSLVLLQALAVGRRRSICQWQFSVGGRREDCCR